MRLEMNTESNVLAGKAALITGAAYGIGRIIARVFAEAGASVVVADIRKAEGEVVAKAIRDAGLRALSVKADLRRESDIKAMIGFTVDNCNHLDIVINNARPKLSNLPFAESLKEWDLAMDVMLKAPALIAKHALPQLLKSGGGSIVNIVSTNAFFISHQPAAYHVAKAGAVQLTRYLAHEFGPHGIRVNAICPALVDLYDENKPLTSDPVNKAVTEVVVPLKRAATAEEIAKAALFLCTDSAAYITGQVLTIDGGITLGDHFHVARRAFYNASGRSS